MASFDLVREVLDSFEPSLREKYGDGLDDELTKRLAALSRGYMRLHGGGSS